MSKSDEQRSRFLLLYSGEDTGYIFSMSLNGTIAPAITMQGVGQITVIWGDGNTDSYTLTGVNQNITHTYGAGGTYNVKIKHAEQITKFDTSTNNNYSFDLSELEKFNENFYYFLVYGSNTITGNLSSLSGLSALYYFRITGSNTITGNLSSLSGLSALNYFLVHGSNTITGNLSSLSGLSALNYFVVIGSNTITGDLSSLNGLSALYYFQVYGSNTITGNLSSLSGLSALSYFRIYGSNTITGDLSSLNGLSALYYFLVYGSNTISDYTTSTWTQTSFNHYEVTPAAGSGLSSSEVDQLLIDMDTGITWSGSGKMLWLAGNNAARTSASDAAVTSLQGKGVTVTTN